MRRLGHLRSVRLALDALGRGERAEHQDLLPVDGHLRRSGEPGVGQPTLQPPGDLVRARRHDVLLKRCNEVIMHRLRAALTRRSAHGRTAHGRFAGVRRTGCALWSPTTRRCSMTRTDNRPDLVGGSLDDQLTARLLHQRIIVLGQEVDDAIANRLCAELLLLSAEDPHRDISLYINSPGGSVSAGLAIYDTMRLIPNDVSTLAMGLAASMGQFLLSAGTRGKRYALPHSRVLMHQGSAGHRRQRGRHRDPGREPRAHQERDDAADRRAHRPAGREGRAGRGPRPVVHRRGGPRVRLRRRDPHRRVRRDAGTLSRPVGLATGSGSGRGRR